MDGKPAAEILQEMLEQMEKVCLAPGKYPEFILSEQEAHVMTPQVVGLMNALGTSLVKHTVAYTVNYLHGVEQQMFFTETGKSLLGYAPWLALRMFALGLYAGGGVPTMKLFELLDGEEQQQFWAELLEVYEDIDLYLDSTVTVTEVDNPFTGETLEEQ